MFTLHTTIRKKGEKDEKTKKGNFPLRHSRAPEDKRVS